MGEISSWPQISLIAPCMPLIIKRYALLLHHWDQKRNPTLKPRFYLNASQNFSPFTIDIYFYISARGLNWGVALALVNGSLTNMMHRDAGIGLIHGAWLLLILKIFPQVHEPRLASWLRGQGHSPGPHRANCHI